MEITSKTWYRSPVEDAFGVPHFVRHSIVSSLSASYISLFSLSIPHDINETRILFAILSFFAEMLSNSAIPQAAIARVTFSRDILSFLPRHCATGALRV